MEKFEISLEEHFCLCKPQSDKGDDRFMHMPFNDSAIRALNSYIEKPSIGLFYLKGAVGSGKTTLVKRTVLESSMTGLLFPPQFLQISYETFRDLAKQIESKSLLQKFQPIIIDGNWNEDIPERFQLFRVAASQGIKIIIIEPEEVGRQRDIFNTLMSTADTVGAIEPMSPIEKAIMVTNYHQWVFKKPPRSFDQIAVCISLLNESANPSQLQSGGLYKKYKDHLRGLEVGTT